jgi:hypothetical protein
MNALIRATNAVVSQLKRVTLRRSILAFLFFAIPAVGQSASADQRSINQATYQPITAEQRLHWFVKSTVGGQTLAAGLFTAGFGTATNSPKEYGPHWAGFAKRYGMRITGTSTSNAMEAGFGSLWGEDPRYFSSADRSFKGRVGNVMRLTFETRRPDGHFAPAYARFIAVPGNNFLSNTWRADSEASSGDAALRTLYGFLGQMGSNAFREFWPDIKTRVFHKGR